MIDRASTAFFAAFPFALLAATAPTQTALERRLDQYEKRKHEALFAASQRHLQLGSWCRKIGLVPQATVQFLRAAEVGEGRNQGADTVVAYMRGLGDAFWRGTRDKPSPSLLTAYTNKVADAERRTRRARLDLARQATAIRRDDEAKAQYVAALRSGGTLGFDGKGGATLDGTVLPREIGDWLRGQTIAVGHDERAFDPAGSATQLSDLCEHRSESVVVRTDLGDAAAVELHAIATALLPHLEHRLDGRPTRPLVLLVLKSHASYAAYLERMGFGAWAVAPGMSNYTNFQSVVCAAGLAPDDLHALVLHEMTHLFFFGVAPAVMPDWYAEGLAEAFGGQGTFTWDGERLTVGGVFRRDRLDAMKQNPLPLRQLLEARAHELFGAGRDEARPFYVQAWAFMRFLDDDATWRKRFAPWEAQCRGAVLGGESAAAHSAPVATSELFARAVGADHDALENAFRAWLERL